MGFSLSFSWVNLLNITFSIYLITELEVKVLFTPKRLKDLDIIISYMHFFKVFGCRNLHINLVIVDQILILHPVLLYRTISHQK